ARSCSSEQFEALGQVVWYKRWVDVHEVIAIVDPVLCSALAQRPVKRRSSGGARAGGSPTPRRTT
ncbi:MAG: hypothetical protein RL701_5953, partial [Pseudomonadota bacterium]